MRKAWKPKLPEYRPPRCVICGQAVTSPPFVATKPHGGRTVYAHRDCVMKEAKEAKT